MIQDFFKLNLISIGMQKYPFLQVLFLLFHIKASSFSLYSYRQCGLYCLLSLQQEVWPWLLSLKLPLIGQLHVHVIMSIATYDNSYIQFWYYFTFLPLFVCIFFLFINRIGFWSAMASNLTFQSRNVLSKKIMVKKEVNFTFKVSKIQELYPSVHTFSDHY